MIFGIAADTQASSFDGGKTQADCFSERRCVDVWDAIRVADSTVREVKSLSRDVPIGIGGVVRSQPKEKNEQVKLVRTLWPSCI
jgi:hypothetical protein